METATNIVITEEVAARMVADVYTALDKGAYQVVPNPHKRAEPLRVTDPRLVEKLRRAMAAAL